MYLRQVLGQSSMRSRWLISPWDKRSFVFAVCLALAGCRSLSTNSPPTIVFNKVPAANLEVSDRTDTIEGRATGVRPGQRIVVYRKADGRWGLQSPSGQSFANVE